MSTFWFDWLRRGVCIVVVIDRFRVLTWDIYLSLWPM
jgi:hypothetical protein